MAVAMLGGPRAECPADLQCLEWAHRYFGDCVCSARDEVSFALGLASVFAWAVAEIPQIITNFLAGSTEGVSLTFLLTWTFGDVFNLVGCYLEPATLPTQFYMAVMYTITTVVLVVQSFYYEVIVPRERGIKKLEPEEAAETTAMQEAAQALLASAPEPSGGPLGAAVAAAASTSEIISVPLSRKTSVRDVHISSARSLVSSHTPSMGSFMPGSHPHRNHPHLPHHHVGSLLSQSPGQGVPHISLRSSPSPAIAAPHATSSSYSTRAVSSVVLLLMLTSLGCVGRMGTTMQHQHMHSHAAGATVSPFPLAVSSFSLSSTAGSILGLVQEQRQEGEAQQQQQQQRQRQQQRHAVLFSSVDGALGGRRRLLALNQQDQRIRMVNGESGSTNTTASSSSSSYGLGPSKGVRRASAQHVHRWSPMLWLLSNLLHRTHTHTHPRAAVGGLNAAPAAAAAAAAAAADDDDDDPATQESALGEVLGWLMAAIYMGGRLPQIWLNIQRGTVEGLSPLMFLFALVGNATYVGSIVVRSTEWSHLKPNLPWLVDAAVCVLLDLFILLQFVYYSFKATNDDEDQLDEFGDDALLK